MKSLNVKQVHIPLVNVKSVQIINCKTKGVVLDIGYANTKDKDATCEK